MLLKSNEKLSRNVYPITIILKNATYNYFFYNNDGQTLQLNYQASNQIKRKYLNKQYKDDTLLLSFTQ